jgi:hypothetical protein
VYLLDKVGVKMDQKEDTKIVVDEVMHVLQNKMVEVQRNMNKRPNGRAVVRQYLELNAKWRRGWC